MKIIQKSKFTNLFEFQAENIEFESKFTRKFAIFWETMFDPRIIFEQK
jgi:hypothetical protein